MADAGARTRAVGRADLARHPAVDTRSHEVAGELERRREEIRLTFVDRHERAPEARRPPKTFAGRDRCPARPDGRSALDGRSRSAGGLE
jgi:hypothetical protein